MEVGARDVGDFAKYLGLVRLQYVNTHSTTFLGLSIETMEVVAWYFEFQIRDSVVKPSFEDGKNIELVRQYGFFYQDKVFPPFQRSNVEMGDLHVVSFLFVCQPCSYLAQGSLLYHA